MKEKTKFFRVSKLSREQNTQETETKREKEEGAKRERRGTRRNHFFVVPEIFFFLVFTPSVCVRE
jgi:hypothetical protein